MDSNYLRVGWWSRNLLLLLLPLLSWRYDQQGSLLVIFDTFFFQDAAVISRLMSQGATVCMIPADLWPPSAAGLDETRLIS